MKTQRREPKRPKPRRPRNQEKRLILRNLGMRRKLKGLLERRKRYPQASQKGRGCTKKMNLMILYHKLEII